MKVALRHAIAVGVFCGLVMCVPSIQLNAQTFPEVEDLALRAADTVATTQRQHILLAGLVNCNLDVELCKGFEESFRVSLEKMLPNVQFVKHEDLVKALVNHGFLPVDAYNGTVMRIIAAETEPRLW